MSLDAKQVLWVAKLARLELSEGELPAMIQQLGAIVEFVDQLRQLDTSGVEPLAHPLPVQNVWRNDEPERSLPVDDALRNAPDRRGNFFAVPPVLE
jgi:aspartyl-tRNA(Asn)/glutamyl-tRNA(Gln) amidotransferase subunit C